jgi:hypothetical protein
MAYNFRVWLEKKRSKVRREKNTTNQAFSFELAMPAKA